MSFEMVTDVDLPMTPLRFEGAPSGGFTATVCPPPTYLALRPMRCSVEHLMKGLGLREAHDLSSS